MCLSNTKPINPDAGGWITEHVGNQAIDQVSTIMMLLKFHFARLLSIESRENIQRLCKSMMGSSTGLGHGSLDIEFSYENINSATNCIETHSCFNHLMFHAVGGLLPNLLASCNGFRNSFNFHDNIELFYLC